MPEYVQLRNIGTAKYRVEILSFYFGKGPVEVGTADTLDEAIEMGKRAAAKKAAEIGQGVTWTVHHGTSQVAAGHVFPMGKEPRLKYRMRSRRYR
jgi:hypothetical protein